MLRLLAAMLLAGLAILQTGCGCCHKNTTRTSAPPCCPPGGGVPPGAVIPGPPPINSNFTPVYAR